jgi:hypothetical protein
MPLFGFLLQSLLLSVYLFMIDVLLYGEWIEYGVFIGNHYDSLWLIIFDFLILMLISLFKKNIVVQRLKIKMKEENCDD